MRLWIYRCLNNPFIPIYIPRFLVPRASFSRFSRSQALPGNAEGEALPRVRNTSGHEAEPRFPRSQAEPRNERLWILAGAGMTAFKQNDRAAAIR